MNHAIVLPIVLPLVTAMLLMVSTRGGIELQRFVALTSTGLLVLLTLYLVAEATTGARLVYYLGDWPAPFGIALALDRLSALMLVLTSVLALFSLLYAVASDDALGPRFHVLFQLQIMGVNGAFLTGDLFNLFVFFEVLLIASYALLMHGGGARRAGAAVHFVVLNLVGSAVFIAALAAIYAGTGTLNMADVSLAVAAVAPGDTALVRLGGLLLLLVFAFKAAVLPLGFWLPRAYSAASAPVACLFAIMTKVGVYSIMRVHTLVFGADAGEVAGLAQPWLTPVALATIVFATLGVLASRTLRVLVSHLMVISVGTLLAAVGLFSRESLAAATFYIIHSTFIGGGLFLLADMIARQRGGADDALERTRSCAQPVLLGSLFFAAAVASAGMPPLSGFVGKLFILRAAIGTPWNVWLWGVILTSGLMVIVALSRAGSALFWRSARGEPLAPGAAPLQATAAAGLVCASLVVMVLGHPLSGYAQATAIQLLDANGYVISMMSNIGVSTPAHVSGTAH